MESKLKKIIIVFILFVAPIVIFFVFTENLEVSAFILSCIFTIIPVSVFSFWFVFSVVHNSELKLSMRFKLSLGYFFVVGLITFLISVAAEGNINGILTAFIINIVAIFLYLILLLIKIIKRKK